MTTSTRVVSLDVYDDPVCPYCYMGYYELGNAIKYAKESLQLPLVFQLEYHPLRLICQEVLPDGAEIDKEAFLTNKFGRETVSNMQKGVLQWAHKRGINITWHSKLASSTQAFRLSLKAFKLGGKMAQYPLHAAMFKAHLEEGKNISDINLLADLAAQLDVMSREDALSFLESDELTDEVNQLASEARERGIHRVPTVVINKKFKIEGAQCAGIYIQMFQRLAAQPETPAAASTPVQPSQPSALPA